MFLFIWIGEAWQVPCWMESKTEKHTIQVVTQFTQISVKCLCRKPSKRDCNPALRSLLYLASIFDAFLAVAALCHSLYDPYAHLAGRFLPVISNRHNFSPSHRNGSDADSQTNQSRCPWDVINWSYASTQSFCDSCFVFFHSTSVFMTSTLPCGYLLHSLLSCSSGFIDSLKRRMCCN